jgi:hypothetical protein
VNKQKDCMKQFVLPGTLDLKDLPLPSLWYPATSAANTPLPSKKEHGLWHPDAWMSRCIVNVFEPDIRGDLHILITAVFKALNRT